MLRAFDDPFLVSAQKISRTVLPMPFFMMSMVGVRGVCWNVMRSTVECLYLWIARRQS